MISAAIAVAVLLQWLFFWGRVVFRRDNRASENAFLLSTIATAFIWTSLAAATAIRSNAHVTTPSIRKSGCASITAGTPSSQVLQKLGSPSRKISEGDSRGPGAEAWVYNDARCVAHVLDDQVRTVDYE